MNNINITNFEVDFDYPNMYPKLTDEQKTKVYKHYEKYKNNIRQEICAYYSDWEDFCSDWCSDNIGYTRTEARELLNGGKGEFIKFSNGEILRFTM